MLPHAAAFVSTLTSRTLAAFGKWSSRTPFFKLATTLFVVASRIAYDHATAASSFFTAFTRRAGP